MWTRSSAARASERMSAPDGRLSRRRFLWSALAVLLATGLSRLARGAAAETRPVLDAALRSALRQSPFVYVSPLLADGSESRCHGEIWFAWLDGAVVAISARSTWRVRALARGLGRARIWVGNYGRWKTLLGVGRNDAFRAAPHFEARGAIVHDAKLLERLMAAYRSKYGAEFSSWEPRMRRGYASGERVLIRYVPMVAQKGVR